jgi:hypothetical protein
VYSLSDAWLSTEGEGEVGEWADSNQGDLPWILQDMVDDEFDGVLLDWLYGWLRKFDFTQPVFSVDVGGIEWWAYEWIVTSAGNRNVGAPSECEQGQSISRGLFDSYVAAHGRDSLKLYFG